MSQRSARGSARRAAPRASPRIIRPVGSVARGEGWQSGCIPQAAPLAVRARWVAAERGPRCVTEVGPRRTVYKSRPRLRRCWMRGVQGATVRRATATARGHAVAAGPAVPGASEAAADAAVVEADVVVPHAERRASAHARRTPCGAGALYPGFHAHHPKGHGDVRARGAGYHGLGDAIVVALGGSLGLPRREAGEEPVPGPIRRDDVRRGLSPVHLAGVHHAAPRRRVSAKGRMLQCAPRIARFAACKTPTACFQSSALISFAAPSGRRGRFKPMRPSELSQ